MAQDITGTNSVNLTQPVVLQIPSPSSLAKVGDTVGSGPTAQVGLKTIFQKLIDYTKALIERTDTMQTSLSAVITANSDDDGNLTAVAARATALEAVVVPAGNIDARLDALEASILGAIGTGLNRKMADTFSGNTGSNLDLVVNPDGGFTDAGYWSNVTPKRILVPTNGRYNICFTGGFGFIANTTTSISIEGKIKGVLGRSACFANAINNGTNSANLNTSITLELFAGDFLQCAVANGGSVSASFSGVVSFLRVG